MSSLAVRCLTKAVWVKGRVRKQGSKPFVNPDKRTGRLSGSAVKPTSKRIKLAATIVGTSESSSPIRQRPKGASLSSKSSSNPEDGGAPSALSIRRRALVQRLQSDAGSRHEMAVTTFGKSGIVPSRSSLRRKTRRACPPCQVPRFRLRTAGACAIRRLRAVCEIRSRYPRCLQAACAMLAHTAAAKHSMMVPQARNTT